MIRQVAGARDALPPKTTRRERTRARICDAAREVFLSQGFSAVSVEQIALAAGTRRSTVYNHFHDKNEILSALADDYLIGVADMIRRLPPWPSRSEIDSWIGEFAAFALRERSPTLLFVHISAVADAPPAIREFGDELFSLFAAQVPAFAAALEPDGQQVRARATAVLRELGWALCEYVGHGGGGLSSPMLEVAGDLFERFVGGWNG